MATTSDTGSRRNKELEKFKRRMIRAVARLMLQEKVPEEEMWEKMKTETGYDCELLWGRMRSVALKKLRRMLTAEDRIDAIARSARMTVTDWLLFDLVLVHEKTDFIGADVHRVKKGELKPLTDLFSLVQKYEIECLSGEQLAKAWTEATLYYNSQGHHVSPMLLQKRWYQLKETTRSCFYRFWFTYRGNAKLFVKAADHMPSMLQMAIARRFKEVVTSPFMEWDEMVQKELIILSEEFDARLRPPKKTIDENAPDLELLEPVIETIDLEADSDTEADPNKQNTENLTPALQAAVKTEPIEIDEDFEDAHNLMKAFDQNEDDDAYESEPGDTEDIGEEECNRALLEALEHDANITSPATDNENTPSCDEIATSASPDEDDIIITTATDKNIILVDGDMTSRACTKETKVVKVEDNSVQDDRITKTIETLPQITSVFGNVDISSDKLSEINALRTEIVSTLANSSSDDDVELITINDDVDVKPVVPVIPAIEGTPQASIVVGMPANETNVHAIPITVKEESVDEIINKTCEKALEKLVDQSVPGALNSAQGNTGETASPFNELHNYLKLVDNGVELVDDGIAYVDEEMEYSNKIDKIKSEDDDEEDESEAAATEEPTEDTAKIDLKLLLYPVVYTTKLDNMGVLDAPYETVNDKLLIDTILAKSKPISKRTVNFDDIKKENDPIKDCSSDEDEAYDNIITNENRVKLSSYLLQKPRTRHYNPIVLCKNPDFNTRLKRLNVGFFSSSRNINLLKHCKPLTIDVSKAFETKLVNGTIYLKPSEEGVHRKAGVTDTERQQQASVVPTAMPLQSLIDNQKVNPIFTEPPSVVPTKTYEDILIAERNKVINLPDISQVRRLNQRLLTAEVTPIQMRNNVVIPPTIVNNYSRADNIAISTSTTHTHETRISEVVEKSNMEITSGINKNTLNASTVIIEDLTRKEVNVETEINKSNSVTPAPIIATNSHASVHGNKKRQSTNLNDPKKKPHAPWKSREMRPSVSWLSMNKRVNPPVDDALLTTDTLNKMLFLLTQEKDERDALMQNTSKVIAKKSNKSADAKKGRPKKQPSDQCTQEIMDDVSNDDVQVVSDAPEENQPIDNQLKENQQKANQLKDNQSKAKPTKNKPPCKTKISFQRSKSQKCCWAQDKIQAMTNEKRAKRHECPPLPCKCCCKEELQDFIVRRRVNRSMEQACKSIESVVQQTYVVDDDTNSDPKNDSNTYTHVNGNVMLVNKPFRISLDDSSGSNCADKATDGQKVPSPPRPDYMDNINSEDTPPVGAEVSVSSSVIPPKVNVQITPNLGNPITINKQSFLPFRGPILRVDNNPIPESSFKKIQYLPSKSLTLPKLQSIPKIYQNKMETSSSSCKCIVPITVDSPHRKIIIDGSSACPMHRNILPKVGSNDRQIFLTSKQILQKPSQSPIYLGKNKILLTNIKFPPELKGEIDPIPQTPLVKIIPTLPLPTGVQLVLQSNGELTYQVDPNMQLDPQKLEGLPEILEAVKKQLNSMEVMPDDSAAMANSIAPNDEIVTLSDDETSEPNKDTAKSQPAITHINKVNVSKDISNTGDGDGEMCDNTIQDSQDTNSKKQQKTGSDANMNITKGQSTNEISLEVSIAHDKDLSDNRPIATGSNTQAKDAQSNNENKETTEVSETFDPSINKVAEEINSAAEENIDSNKGKNILSDLMEMSGISAEDVTPAPAVTTQPEDEFTQPALKQFLLPQSVLVAPKVPQTAIIPNVQDNTSEFSAIMSFAELKYACMKNGLFFKLDFETGSIMPINVCIKKHGDNKPSPVKIPGSVTIDLTDDDASEKKPKQPLSASTGRSILIANQESKYMKRVAKAKPLKLFKSVHPSILRRTNEPNVFLVKNLESFKNIPILKGLKRKQELNKVEARIDLVDSDCPMEEEYLESSGSDGESCKRNAQSDESSDEEPLSKIAKRMRDNTKDDVTPDVSNPEAEKTSPDKDKEREFFSDIYDEQSEEEEPDDDCILGV